ncbi:DDE-type integrase/transposase/recombinase [Roseobacter sp. GAI101]|uniref:DDE-type integrase/transposase/recombinase n=1 Tax=Roseobacter sp. (strain GAI101) TaxID=391589 RepID=UPI0012EE25C7|nr:DDE-type integrase/transposase/recombinase [Roseobacter sp. GAI101]
MFSPPIAHILWRQQPRPGDVCHLGDVVLKVAGRSCWLCHAIDQHGTVLERILQSSRDKRAAKRAMVPGIDHWSHKSLNARAVNIHLPFQRREWVMQGFRSPGVLPRFVPMQVATRKSPSVPSRSRRLDGSRAMERCSKRRLI